MAKSEETRDVLGEATKNAKWFHVGEDGIIRITEEAKPQAGWGWFPTHETRKQLLARGVKEWRKGVHS